MKPTAWFAAVTFLIGSTAVHAQSDTERAASLTALAQCRTLADNAQRLACFDRTAAAFDEAERRGELFVTSRAEIQKTKRSLFGLNLPSLSLFKGRDGKDEPELREIESTVARASYSNLKWLIVLADGSRWRQTEPRSIVDPRTGDKAVVRKASLGSYFLKIKSDAGFRVERVN